MRIGFINAIIIIIEEKCGSKSLKRTITNMLLPNGLVMPKKWVRFLVLQFTQNCFILLSFTQITSCCGEQS